MTAMRFLASSPFAPAAFAAWLLTISVTSQSRAAAPQGSEPAQKMPAGHTDAPFLTSHDCMACHNGLTTPTGEDVSIGVAWRASMMANSSRDPYWQASVRRETIDHPSATREIEDECAKCHMPMSRARSRAANELGAVFAHLPIADRESAVDRLAADGVSCTLCHQIGPERLGSRESFTGGFVIRPPTRGERPIFGPFEIDAGRTAVMRSATGMTPKEAPHVRESAICATCHTLYTKTLGTSGEVVGELPEQVPYLEWQHSAFREQRSCQACHMPAVAEPTRISAVLGDDRIGLGRHTFVGGNSFMLRMLNRYRDELGVEARPQELDAAAQATLQLLQRETATVSVVRAGIGGDRLDIDVGVRNLTGHKLPTGYPSRRAWLRLVVRDRHDQIVFSSGEITPAGLIRGNANDADGARFEPHYNEIRSEEQVQIYESVLRDIRGNVTTGLLQATAYAKDNRLLPRGFDKTTAHPDIAVVGAARQDDDFAGEADRVRYIVDVARRESPFRIDVELRFQPIAYRWAQNLKAYDAKETRRFVAYFDAMSAGSSVILARSVTSVP